MPSLVNFLYRPIGILKTLLKANRRMKNSIDVPRLFLLNIPSHRNLGDHLISIAEQEFLKDYFPEREVILVTSADLYYSIRFALWDVCDSDVLCVTGGGFMGSLYDEENRFLKIIKRYPNNKIVFFPQTIYYFQTDDGEKQIRTASWIYQSHHSLYVAARDQSTYDLLVNRLMPEAKERAFLVPDMALYKHCPQEQMRNGVIWCLRDDAEVVDSNDSVVDNIKSCLSNLDLEQRYTDTYVSYSVAMQDETQEVNNKLKEISSAKLVITDRLHGMIMSIITDTPVIALNNVSGKVGQAYKVWFKDIPFVRFVESASEVPSAIEELLKNDNYTFNFDKFKQLYQSLVDAINE